MLIQRLWQHQPGKYFFLCSKTIGGKWEEHCFKRKEIRKVDAFLEEHRDRDLYFCPHGFSEPQRLKPYAELPSLLWGDLDEADPRTMDLKPTVAIESSPGRFVGLWVLNDTMTEELNRRLTYMLGADKGGWDLTQVLRIPGTTNYKYSSLPRVKILWSDGPEYTVRAIKKALPEEVIEDEEEEGDASEVYMKYEKKLPVWCRRELIHGKVTPGKRSEMIWKIQNTLIECGLTTSEAFVLVKASPWNKFKGRRNEDEQLKRELDKVVAHHMQAKKAVVGENDGEDEYVWVSTPISEVEAEHLDWIWYPYLARGEVTILEGDPGLGKSYLAQMIGGGVVDGERLPAVKKGDKIVQGKVVAFDMENTAGSVTRRRLEGNGVKRLDSFFQEERPFSIDDPETMDRIYDALERVRPALAVFDTVNTYLGKADAFKGHEAQQAFIKFKEIARRFNCCVLVLRHLTKNSKERALYRGQGSIAFAGVARVVITVGTMPNDPEVRAMAISKLNIARKPPALTFRIDAMDDTLKERDRSRFSWGEFVDIEADEILGVPESDSSAKEASAWLKKILEENEIEERRLMRMAEAKGFDVKALSRVQGIQKREVKGKTYWCMA